MLGFFRRALSSKIVLGFFALIILAFMVTGVQTGGMFSGASSAAIATVGGKDIEAETIRQRAESEVQQAQRNQPGATMAAFVQSGGLGPLIDQYIDGRAIERWAEKAGFTVSRKLVDGEIASIPAFAGPTGKFDPQAMAALLAQQRMTEPQLRHDMSADLLRRQVLVPLASGMTVAAGLASPYGALLMEAREGLIGVVPTVSIAAGSPATPAEIAAEYERNIARYTLPERRVIRYAVFGADSVTAPAPSDAEIAAAYKGDAAKYAAAETRTLQQVILPDQAAAKAFAAKVRGGESFAAAAKAQGFGPGDIAVTATTRDAFAKATAPAVAAAAYAAPAGGLTDPVKSDFGWHVVHVARVKNIPGRSLDDVRGEIVIALQAKTAEALLADKVNRLEDAVNGGATLDEAIAKEKLTAVSTPPLLAGGLAPDQPGYQFPTDLAPLLKPAFDAVAGDKPTVESLGATKRYALLALGQVLPSAPRPLAAVRETVVRDIQTRHALDKARAVAQQIIAQTAKGLSLERAFADAKLGLSPPRPVSARRIDLQQQQRPVPPMELLFTLAPGKTQLLPLPSDQGFYVVHLNKITPGNAAADPRMVGALKQEMAQSVSNELIQQFANAAKQVVGVTRHEQAIAKLRADLSGAAVPAGR